MPGPLIQQSATVMCVHGGQAMPVTPNPAVTLGGMPTRLLSDRGWSVVVPAFRPPSHHASLHSG
jgi:hypothetical protein